MKKQIPISGMGNKIKSLLSNTKINQTSEPSIPIWKRAREQNNVNLYLRKTLADFDIKPHQAIWAIMSSVIEGVESFSCMSTESRIVIFCLGSRANFSNTTERTS